MAVRVHNLGKRYVIGGKQEKYATLRDTIVDVAAAPFRRVRGVLRGESAAGLKEEIWALKDVSFEVKHGEVVGIIGRNGAGKSTLLKILSRITEPTTGYADVYGRIGALLEVGTGFHPELTGRENIYLNGAILGMSREEIRRKFDEIVDFAGVEKFIDTPVKHYSSGMGLRLGFAVAAHLEPEILIVDEVLAVGDAEFQKKSMGKMSQVAGEGRTVLFVSHNMAAVQQICSRGIVLARGTAVLDEPSHDAVRYYLGSLMSVPTGTLAARTDRVGTGSARLSACRLLDEAGQQVEALTSGRQIEIEFEYEVRRYLPILVLAFTIYNHLGVAVTHIASDLDLIELDPSVGSWQVRCRIPDLPLPKGEYRIAVNLSHGGLKADWMASALSFSVVGSTFFASGRTAPIEFSTALLRHQWLREHEENAGS